MKAKTLSIAIAASMFSVLGTPAMADSQEAKKVLNESWSDRARMSDYKNEKERLEKMLSAAGARSDYATILQKAGYRITSINEDNAEELEYEIVKGDQSYEVQLEFDESAGQASEIDVATNLWRADSTKRAMADANYMPTAVFDKDIGARFRDKNFIGDWNSEKERLQKLMPAGLQVQEYQKILSDDGYRVTSFNDREADYAEFEIVKGSNSYEVQIDRNPSSKLATEIDVTTNLWQSEQTERALGQE